MQQRLIIVGAGGFGREVYTWAQQMIATRNDLTIGGFLDRNRRALAGFDMEHTVIDDPEQYEPGENDLFTCAVGEPELKLKLAESLRDRGARFVHVIHPTAIIGPGCSLGEGAILCPFAVLTNHVTLGDFVSVNVHAGAGHDAVLGDGATLSAHVDVTGGARLGRGVMVGSHATVLSGVSVHEFAVVGAGSVVVRDVPARTTVMGAPARPIWMKTEPTRNPNKRIMSHVGGDPSDRVSSS